MPTPFIVKRKLQSATSSGGGGDVDRLGMSIIQYPLSDIGSGEISSFGASFDSLTVNHLVVKSTLRMPYGTDKYK